MLLDVVDTFSELNRILTPDDNFLVVPVLLSVGEVWMTKLQIRVLDLSQVTCA